MISDAIQHRRQRKARDQMLYHMRGNFKYLTRGQLEGIVEEAKRHIQLRDQGVEPQVRKKRGRPSAEERAESSKSAKSSITQEKENNHQGTQGEAKAEYYETDENGVYKLWPSNVRFEIENLEDTPTASDPASGSQDTASVLLEAVNELLVRRQQHPGGKDHNVSNLFQGHDHSLPGGTFPGFFQCENSTKKQM